jgi:hypothetical protein
MMMNLFMLFMGFGALVLILIAFPLLVMLGGFKVEDTFGEEDQENGCTTEDK